MSDIKSIKNHMNLEFYNTNDINDNIINSIKTMNEMPFSPPDTKCLEQITRTERS